MADIPSGEHCPAAPSVLVAAVCGVDQYELVLLSDAGWSLGFFLMHNLSRSGNTVRLSALSVHAMDTLSQVKLE